MNHRIWVGPKRDFDPNEVRELAVALENCCAAIPEARMPKFRERVASRLFNWATLGNVDAVALYLRAMEYYRSRQFL